MSEPHRINPWWLPEESEQPPENDRPERTTREYPARRAGDRPTDAFPLPQERERERNGEG
jgi:hypothetical protein